MLIKKIYQIINIFRMMFVYHYVIIPFHPQYLPRHAPLILQGAGCQRAGCRWGRTPQFSLLLFSLIETLMFHFKSLMLLINRTPLLPYPGGGVVQNCTTRRIFNFTHRNFFSGATIICDF